MKRITPGVWPLQYFRDVTEKLKHSPENIKIACAVLVDGQKQVDVARTFGKKPKRVSDIVRQIRQAEQNYIIAGWVTKMVTIPPDLLPELDDLLQQAAERWREYSLCQAADERYAGLHKKGGAHVEGTPHRENRRERNSTK